MAAQSWLSSEARLASNSTWPIASAPSFEAAASASATSMTAESASIRPLKSPAVTKRMPFFCVGYEVFDCFQFQ